MLSNLETLSIIIGCVMAHQGMAIECDDFQIGFDDVG
jgi:hypothetical protein